MKTVIFGANNRGCMIATSLFEDHDVSIIDKTENITDDFYKLDIEIIAGNVIDPDVLTSAGITGSDVFVACSDDDEMNILACTVVKALCSAKTVCFLKDEIYVKALETLKETEKSKFVFADFIINPKVLLTNELFRIITVPDATNVENFADGKARMLVYPVKEKSNLADKKIKDVKFPKNTLIVGITDENGLFIPDGETVLKINDRAIFMGTKNSLNELAEKFFNERKNVKSVVIIGGGTIGCRLAEILERHGISPKIIEKNHERCEEISRILLKTLVINGDGTDVQLLRTEEIEDSDVVVSVTDNDEKNLLASLLAKQSGVKKVISRVVNEHNIRLFEKVGIDVAVSENDAAVHEINVNFVQTDISILATVARGQGEVIEVFLPGEFQSCKIMDLKMPHKAIIAIIERKGDVIVPNGETVIYPCDNLIIFTMEEYSSAIKKYLFGHKA